MKSRICSIDSLDEKTKRLKINAKPNLFLVILFLISLFLVIKSYLIYLATIGLISSVYCLVFLPNKIILEFDQNYLIVYDTFDKTECSIVYYDEIKTYKWQTSHSYDNLIITLYDGTIKKIPCIKKNLVLKKLRFKTIEFSK